MYKSGDWILDKVSGMLGTVSNVFLDGVSAKFGGMTVIRRNENIELAPLDLEEEDIAAMIDLALETKDKSWFNQLTERLGVKVYG